MTNARSTFDELTTLADDLKSALSAGLDISEIYQAIRNTPDSPLFFFGNPYAWRSELQGASLALRARKS